MSNENFNFNMTDNGESYGWAIEGMSDEDIIQAGENIDEWADGLMEMGHDHLEAGFEGTEEELEADRVNLKNALESFVNEANTMNENKMSLRNYQTYKTAPEYYERSGDAALWREEYRCAQKYPIAVIRQTGSVGAGYWVFVIDGERLIVSKDRTSEMQDALGNIWCRMDESREFSISGFGGVTTERVGGVNADPTRWKAMLLPFTKEKIINLHDEETDVSLTTVSSADGHSRYGVSGFLLEEDAITEDQFDDGDLPPVTVYVVETSMTIEMYLDKDEALNAYTAQVDAYAAAK